MAQAKRARGTSNILAISTNAKRAKNAKDHINGVSNKRRFIVFLMCFCLLVLITAVAMGGSLSKLKSLDNQKELLHEEKENLTLTSERLAEEVDHINTREFVEYMARKLLGWVKPTDTKYIIDE